MEIQLTPVERSNLALEAARRGISLEELIRLLLAKQAGRLVAHPSSRKSNGWCPRRQEYLGPNGAIIAGDTPTAAPRRRKAKGASQ